MNSIIVARNAEVGTPPRGEIGAILSRRKWQTLIMFVLIVAVVTVATLRMPKQYKTRMKILVKNERANMVVSAGINAPPAPPREVSETEINTEIELLNSNDLLHQVVTASGLGKLEITGGTSAGQRQQLALENAVKRLQHELKISPVRKSNVIEIKYTAGNPHQAVAVLRQLAVSYLEAHLRVHRDPGTHEFFSNQADHYQSDLKDAETRLTDFSVKNNTVLFAQQKEDLLRRASESSSMLLAADTGILEYTRKLAEARDQMAAAEPRVITQNRTLSSQTSVERLGTMLVELQNRRTQLLSKYRSDDRVVEEVSQEVNDTRAALQEAKSLTGSDQTTDVNPIGQTLALEIAKEQVELAGLEARHQALSQQTNSYRMQLSKLGNSTMEYDDLIRGQKEAEDNYLLYARKTEEARIADSLDQRKIANVTVAENPVEPQSPSEPNVPMNLACGTLFAAFVSLGIAFSADYFSQRFSLVATDSRPGAGPATGAQPSLGTVEKPADLESLTGLPVLATIRRF